MSTHFQGNIKNTLMLKILNETTFALFKKKIMKLHLFLKTKS